MPQRRQSYNGRGTLRYSDGSRQYRHGRPGPGESRFGRAEGAQGRSRVAVHGDQCSRPDRPGAARGRLPGIQRFEQGWSGRKLAPFHAISEWCEPLLQGSFVLEQQERTGLLVTDSDDLFLGLHDCSSIGYESQEKRSQPGSQQSYRYHRHNAERTNLYYLDIVN